MYLPINSITLDKQEDPQIRLGLQGWAGTGKTWAALTFLNPVVLNFNRGLGAHRGRKDVIEVPFYSDEWLKKFNANYGAKTQSGEMMQKQLLEIWLATEAKKLEEDQTLIIDGQSDIQSLYHKWWEKNPMHTKAGVIDDFGEYKQKLIFFGNIMDQIKSLRCNVVWICHEIEQKNKDGSMTGKVRPLLSGQFEAQLAGNFTDWFRQHAVTKLIDEKLTPEVLSKWIMTKDEFKLMQSKFPRDTIYCWQTDGDDTFDGKCSSLISFPKFIPAEFDSFKKYMRPMPLETLISKDTEKLDKIISQ